MRVSNRIVNLLYESSTKDDKIWKLIDKYEAGEMSKEEVEKEVKRLNKGNKAEIEADLALIFNEYVEESTGDPEPKEKPEKMNESKDVDLNNEDLTTGFVNVDIGEGNDAIHFMYNKDTQEVIYTKGYAAGRVHKKTTYSELPNEEFPYTTEGIIKAYIDTKLNTINKSAAYEASEHGFDQIVLDSYNHLTNDLGKNPSLEDIVDDIINNYDQTFITDESPEDAIQAIKDVRHILRKHDLTYDNLEESSTIDNDPDLNPEEVQSEVDYWTDVDNSRTEDVSGREPVGVYTLSNTQAIYVYDIKYDIDDMVLAGDSSDPTKAKWRFINYEDLIDEETGEAIPFFYYNAIKVPMNEVMRTNI